MLSRIFKTSRKVTTIAIFAITLLAVTYGTGRYNGYDRGFNYGQRVGQAEARLQVAHERHRVEYAIQLLQQAQETLGSTQTTTASYEGSH